MEKITPSPFVELSQLPKEAEMKRRGFTVLHLLIILALFAIAAMILFPMFMEKKNRRELTFCQDNFERINLAFKQYIQDYDEKYPQVKVKNVGINGANPYGWADAIQPYMKDVEALRCPSQSHSTILQDPTKNGYTDYWFNRRLAGVPEEKIEDSGSTILAGDGNDGTDATDSRYSLSTLPTSWRTDTSSPACRHYWGAKGANYVFVDGHIKWMEPKKISDNGSPKTNRTFAIR